jgi:hypothetical protein
MGNTSTRDSRPPPAAADSAPVRAAKRQYRWEQRSCVAAAAGVLLVAAALFWYAQPWADDFARGYKGRVQGVIPATTFEYFNWTGRWAASGLNYLLTSSFDLVRVYQPLLLIVPSLLALSIYALLRAARIGATRLQSLALAASALALYWTRMPDPGETVYWLTGSVDNLAGIVLSLLLLAGLLRGGARRLRERVPAAAGLCLLAVLATGFHEVFGLLLCTALAGGVILTWPARTSDRWMWTICLIAAVCGFLVVYAAPGNEVRRADFPLAADLEVTLQLTFGQIMSAVPRWILDIRLLAGTLSLLLIMPQALIGQRPGSPTARDVAVVGLTWTAVVVGAFAAVSWAIGMAMAPRTLNGIYLVFLTGWFWTFVMLVRRFPERATSLAAARPLLRGAAVAIFCASMLATGNTRRGIVELAWAAPVYSAAMDERWRLLEEKAAAGELDAVVEPLPARPRSYIKYFELTEDPDFWVNSYVASYFGLRTVRLAGEAPKSGAGATNPDKEP